MERLKNVAVVIAGVLLGMLASILGPDLYWLHEQHEAAKAQAAAMALIQNAQKPQAPAPPPEPKKEK